MLIVVQKIIISKIMFVLLNVVQNIHLFKEIHVNNNVKILINGKKRINVYKIVLENMLIQNQEIFVIILVCIKQLMMLNTVLKNVQNRIKNIY